MCYRPVWSCWRHWTCSQFLIGSGGEHGRRSKRARSVNSLLFERADKDRNAVRCSYRLRCCCCFEAGDKPAKCSILIKMHSIVSTEALCATHSRTNAAAAAASGELHPLFLYRHSSVLPHTYGFLLCFAHSGSDTWRHLWVECGTLYWSSIFLASHEF